MKPPKPISPAAGKDERERYAAYCVAYADYCAKQADANERRQAGAEYEAKKGRSRSRSRSR